MNKITMKFLASACGIVASGFAGSAVAQVPPYYSWEAASEFDDTSNANGNNVGNVNCSAPTFNQPWCYGWEPAGGIGTGFTPFTFQMVRVPGVIQGWGLNNTNSLAIVHNMTSIPQAPAGQPQYASHALDFLPGNGCEYAVLRFYAPYKAKYKISGQFYGLWLDNNGYENADVHIYVNNVSVYNSLIDMHNQPTHVSFTVTPAFASPPNGTIDFIVGCGTNNDNYYDHVGLNAVIERLR